MSQEEYNGRLAGFQQTISQLEDSRYQAWRKGDFYMYRAFDKAASIINGMLEQLIADYSGFIRSEVSK